MSKNYMKEVCELLGVELGEKFNVKGLSYKPYYINENGLYDCYGYSSNGLLFSLLTGKAEIKKPILDDKERQYLASVIAPKSIYENVDYIAKTQIGKRFCIMIIDKQGFKTHLPYFSNKNMYKGMEFDIVYTLKELGLDRR